MLSDLQKNIDDRMWTNVAYGKQTKTNFVFYYYFSFNDNFDRL